VSESPPDVAIGLTFEADGEVIPAPPYTGPAQHTYTAACDGFHWPGACPATEAEGSEIITEAGEDEPRD
jgi:hypothetical protein